MGLKEAMLQYFNGDLINQTENRSVLHTALRLPEDAVVNVDGINVVPEIYKVKEKIKVFSSEIINGVRKGYTGKSFTDIVNIGIGGSDLGPAMVVEALQFYKNDLNVHFVSNVDGDHVNELLRKINPETTLFVIVSKTFTTQETLTNSETIRTWFLKNKETLPNILSRFLRILLRLRNSGLMLIMFSQCGIGLAVDFRCGARLDYQLV